MLNHVISKQQNQFDDRSAHQYRLELNKWDSTNLVPRSPTAKGKTDKDLGKRLGSYDVKAAILVFQNNPVRAGELNSFLM